MKFFGQVFEENNEMRGKVTFFEDDKSSPEQIRFFKSFDDLKQILEKEYKSKAVGDVKNE